VEHGAHFLILYYPEEVHSTLKLVLALLVPEQKLSICVESLSVQRSVAFSW
jgi:hypothetical protein